MAKSNEEYKKIIVQAAEEANLGQSFFSNQQYDQAIEKFKSAIAIFETISQEVNLTIDIARCYNALGAAYRNNGKYDDSLQSHAKAFGIQINALEPNHIELATTYNNLTIIFIHKNKLEEVKKFCNLTLEIFKQNNIADDHPEAIKNNMLSAMMKARQQEYDKAINIFNKVLGICEQSQSSSEKFYSEIYSCYFNLGCLYENKREYKKSIESFQSAITLCHERYGEDFKHPMLVELYNKLSIVYEQDGQAEKSEECAQKAAKLRGKHASADPQPQSNEESSAGIEQQDNRDKSKADSFSEARPDQEQDMDNSGNAETDTLTKQIKDLVLNGDSTSVIQEDPPVDTVGGITELEE